MGVRRTCIRMWRIYPLDTSCYSCAHHDGQCQVKWTFIVLVVRFWYRYTEGHYSAKRPTGYVPLRHTFRTFAVVVRPSVCRLSVCNVRAPYSGDWNFRQYFYIIRNIIYPDLLTRRMVGEGRPLLREILGQPTPVGTKALIFNRYSPVAPQP